MDQHISMLQGQPSHLFHRSVDDGTSTIGNDDPHRRSAKRDSASSSTLDCDSLRSSIKRVKLSLSPGELRLQRDLMLLEPNGWVRVGTTDMDTSKDTNMKAGRTSTALDCTLSSSTWIHNETKARLSLVDSLRLCLVLPDQSIIASTQSNAVDRNSQSAGEHSHQEGEAFASSHRSIQQWNRNSSSYSSSSESANNDDRNAKRMWIQFPRRYPHKPPVVSRLEGFNIDRVCINDAPPPAAQVSEANEGCFDNTFHTSTKLEAHNQSPMAATLSSAFQGGDMEGNDGDFHYSYTGGRSEGSTVPTIASLSKNYQVCAGGTTVVWNHWSPVVGLDEFLDFLLQLAQASNLHEDSLRSTNSPYKDNAALICTDSFSSLYQSTISTPVVRSEVFIDERKTEDLMSMSPTPHARRAEDHLLSSLDPNRFDLGYEKVRSRSAVNGDSKGWEGCMTTEPFREISSYYGDDDDDDDSAMQL